MRNLLIAALFHDFDHPGHPHPSEGDPDRINIPIAITGLRRYVMPADRPLLLLIEATHYPYRIGSGKLDLLGHDHTQKVFVSELPLDLSKRTGLIISRLRCHSVGSSITVLSATLKLP
jgi:hypothetical protein